MEKMQKGEHEFPHGGETVGHVVPGERFERIKEMILLPEENVSFTEEPHEIEDTGFPTTLVFLIGMMVFFGLVMLAIYLGVGNTWVSITLGNHFTK